MNKRDCNCNDCVLADDGVLRFLGNWLLDNWMLFPVAAMGVLDLLRDDYFNALVDLTLFGMIILLQKILRKLDNTGPWY